MRESYLCPIKDLPTYFYVVSESHPLDVIGGDTSLRRVELAENGELGVVEVVFPKLRKAKVTEAAPELTAGDLTAAKLVKVAEELVYLGNVSTIMLIMLFQQFYFLYHKYIYIYIYNVYIFMIF